MNVGTLVRKLSNGYIGVVVKVTCDPSFKDRWCEVLYHSENIIGCWDMELEAV